MTGKYGQLVPVYTLRKEYSVKHIEAETKWPPFRRRRFQTHVPENFRISIEISPKFVPRGFT